MSKNVTLYRSDGAVLEEFLVATDYSLIKNKPTNFPPTAHSHDYLTAIDNRLATPADINSYGTKQIRAYFTDYGGMTTGVKNYDYQDLLIMDTYSDKSGGKINALSFDKSEMKIYHFQAGFQANSWGNPKVLAYKEDIPIALKNPYPLTIQRNGTTVGSYDGSTAQTINIIDSDLDTKNTAGSTDTSNKIFLIGATSQSTYAQTYSHDTVYIGTDGAVYSEGKKTIVEGDSRLTNSRPASDVYAWAKKALLDANDVPVLPISKITNLQSTLDGKVPTTRTINGKALSSNISLTASDIGAVSTSGTAYNSTRWGNYQIRVGSYSNGDNGYITFSY